MPARFAKADDIDWFAADVFQNSEEEALGRTKPITRPLDFAEVPVATGRIVREEVGGLRRILACEGCSVEDAGWCEFAESAVLPCVRFEMVLLEEAEVTGFCEYSDCGIPLKEVIVWLVEGEPNVLLVEEARVLLAP